MKTIRILIVFALPFAAYSQSLDPGRYHMGISGRSIFQGRTVDFRNDSTFRMNVHECSNIYLGEGGYRITKDSLLFTFDYPDWYINRRADTSSVERTDTFPNNFVFKIVNYQTGKNMGYFNFAVNNGKLNKEYPDDDGWHKLLVDSSIAIIHLYRGDVKLETNKELELPVIRDRAYIIKVEEPDANLWGGEGSVERYKILSFEENYLKISSKYEVYEIKPY